MGGGDTIYFALPAGSETIFLNEDESSGSAVRLSAGKSFTVDGSNFAGSGRFVTLQVPAPGASAWRLFSIDAAGETFTFKNLKLRGGLLFSMDLGGVIRILGGTLDLLNVIVTDGAAFWGGGIGIEGSEGDPRVLNIRNCAFRDNGGIPWETSSGGAISTAEGGSNARVTIRNSVFSNNAIPDFVELSSGGALYISAGAVFEIHNTTFFGNSADYRGGAVALWGASECVMDGVTMVNNRVRQDHGGGSVPAGYILEIDRSELRFREQQDRRRKRRRGLLYFPGYVGGQRLQCGGVSSRLLRWIRPRRRHSVRRFGLAERRLASFQPDPGLGGLPLLRSADIPSS